MNSDRCDVLIVGAGTAGCACAATLPPGITALLIDRTDPRTGRCCGGLIAHDAQAALRRLGSEMPPGVRVQPEPRFVHALDLESGREQVYRRDYWNVDRSRFDSWLLDLACRRAEHRSHVQFRAAERDGTEWRVSLNESGTERTVRCRWIVGADGATSAVRRTLFGDRPAPLRLLAVQPVMPDCPRLVRQEVIFSERLTDFYAWAIPKPDCVLVGAAFSDPHQAGPRFNLLLAEMCRRYGIERRVLNRCSRYLTHPRRPAELCAGDNEVLLVGEAAGLVSPSSGEGISYALSSGMAAARALASGAPGRSYAASFRRPARAVCAKLIKARIILAPRLRRLALRLPWYP
jgi:geranylgeranyl diphosphate/geranylgeranyl-bacteriochlorophyllide a reductase